MATSGSVSSAFTSWDNIVFSWWVNSQSVFYNTTRVGWKMELVAGSAGQIISSADKQWKVILDGNTYTGTNKIGVSNNSTITLASGETVISHNSNGTKSFSFSFYQELGITFNGTYIASDNGLGTGTLDTIARKTTLSVPNGTLGTEQSMDVTCPGLYTHTITYTCGSASGTVCTKSQNISISWTPPLDLAYQNTTGTSVVVNFTIEGFDYDGKSTGTSTATAVYQMPGSVSPYMASSLSDPTGWRDVFGVYVQGQSKLKLSINPHGVYGASITRVRTVFDGYTYEGTSVESKTILQTGTVQVTIMATDSRGRTVIERPSISVAAYSYPALTGKAAYRSDASGNASQTGGYITVKFSSSVSNPNSKNGAWYKVKYKKATASDYTTVSLDAYTGNFAVSNGSYTFAADAGSYDIQILVGDRIKTNTYAVSGPATDHTVSFLKKDGKIVGMAVGKVAEHEGCFDVGWELKLSGGGDISDKIEALTSNVAGVGTTVTKLSNTVNGLSDKVVESGTSDGWTYRKWDSGLAECWKTVTHSTTVATAWGGMYVGNAVARQNYPFSFIEKPVEIVSITSGSKMGFLYPEQSGYGVNGTSATAMYNVASLSSYTSAVTYYFNYHVMGRWK